MSLEIIKHTGPKFTMKSELYRSKSIHCLVCSHIILVDLLFVVQFRLMNALRALEGVSFVEESQASINIGTKTTSFVVSL